MGSAIGDLLPSAVAVALSPIPIIAVVLILGTPKARSNGPAFAAGWVIGLSVVGVVVVLLASGADDPDSGSSTTVDVIKLLAGLLFLVMAWKQWQSRPGPGEEATLPEWMSAVDSLAPGRCVVLGLALSGLNPKNLALTAAAAASIAQAGLDAGGTAVSLGIFVVLGSLSVAGSVVFYLLATERAEAPLAAVKEFMSRHNAVIMMVVLLVLGAKLVGGGIAGLSD